MLKANGPLHECRVTICCCAGFLLSSVFSLIVFLYVICSIAACNANGPETMANIELEC